MKRKALFASLLLSVCSVNAQNPYLPLWEHLPDGEPRVFEDPDAPGKYRAYIIGSHDVKNTDYCGPDIRMWSAPVEDLSQWKDEGPIFTHYVDGQWDTMFAPDLVEVKDKATGKKTYYLYPHSRGWRRIPMVCKGDRPDGPFTPINLTPDGRACVDGSMIDFDPSVFIENITDKKDKDFDKGFRAYVFYGFQHSTAAEMDQNTMYSVRPGTQIHDYFIPASSRYGEVRDPKGTEYPALYKGQNPGEFNFFEASSIRQVGNKYVMVFSGYSGPDYGLGSTNSALRYAFGDSPLGPWRSGGVLVDSRGVVLNEDGSKLTTTNFAHNTHGSLQEINGQWYVFYHRQTGLNEYARQAMVAPITVDVEEGPGGKVQISEGEYNSEGFSLDGLDPLERHSAGIACWVTGPKVAEHEWPNNKFYGSYVDATYGTDRNMEAPYDLENNTNPVVNNTDGSIVGYKYFNFTATQEMEDVSLLLRLIPEGIDGTITIMVDRPWTSQGGKVLGTIELKADMPRESTEVSVELPALSELTGKHALYFTFQSETKEKSLCILQDFVFSE